MLDASDSILCAFVFCLDLLVRYPPYLTGRYDVLFDMFNVTVPGTYDKLLYLVCNVVP